ncbi:2-Ketovalerate ferredoxin oxidoreductase [Elusimicrobium minutum Pei191]|uniref:2-Ketovalerate ferredoxin oxidoreductase n=1 Tax=Elusimicrobium minutum (strain Pei191) TaxID=445932 RepID=B2KES8_ELUMP|nr:3-methyl-2-oxobutanoate dehydrogenase subunit VorB [Elusimicrobium minutum]ACC99024.1 2-Ketovalerate ferredoxin oxidoreductase [Elusimicrobium minutum Pei191]
MKEKILMKGNEAMAEGALRAGCRFFAGYPITPQNEVPEYMAAKMADRGGAFVQAESETSAINMIYGAAATGARSMTSSSSPGISLKQEGISYLAGADLPCLIANVMRGGPGLGSITGAQGDYFQATRGGGNGDYRTIVLAPNSVEEMGNFPKLAFELSEKYRIPAMILADGVLGQMMEGMSFNFEPVDPKDLKEPEWALGTHTGERKKRMVFSYKLKDGELEVSVFERAEKYKAVEENEVLFEERYTEDAEVILVAYGISARAALAGIEQARAKGVKVGLLRPITLWPFPYKRLCELASNGKCKAMLCVEMSLGQMIVDVKLAAGGQVPVYLHARPGGGMPAGEDIVTAINSVLTGKTEKLYPHNTGGCGCKGGK